MHNRICWRSFSGNKFDSENEHKIRPAEWPPWKKKRGVQTKRTGMTIPSALLFHASHICVPREVIFMWRHVLTVYSDRFRLSINGSGAHHLIFGRYTEMLFIYFSSARFNVTNTLLGWIGLIPSSEMRRRVVAFFYSFIIFITTTSPESFEAPAQWRRGLFLLTTKTALLLLGQ